MDCEITNLDCFEHIELLCFKGDFEVHKIRKKDTGAMFCAFILKYNIYNIGRNQAINLYRELTIFPNLNHPSISKFCYYSPVDFSNDTRPVIITEFCETLSLHPIFSSTNTHKLKVIYSICAGMAYLHSHNILHRDLKPDTIFLDDRLFPKISCFHLCKQIDPNVPERSIFTKGTPAYLSPEIFTKQEYSKSSDVYSFSIIFYQIMTNNTNFLTQYKENPGFLRQFVVGGGRPNNLRNIPKCYQKLIEKCWSQEPKNRPTFDQILYQLKNDQEFITEGVSEEEFREFVKFVDESISSFDPSRRIDQLGIDFNCLTNHFDFCIQTIFDTEFDSISMYMYYFDLKNFSKERRIGQGRFSNVYEIFYQDDRKSETRYLPFSAKIFKSKIDDIYDLFSQEVIINTQLYHPCICRFIGYSPVSFGGKKYPIIVSDCYENCSLSKLFQYERNINNKKILNETMKLIIIYGIAAGMSFVHSRNVIHRDLNPSNIYLDSNLFPKIGDFGTAEFQFNLEMNKNEEEDDYYYESFVVNKTPLYMSPELLSENESLKEGDVYSFAFIIYELITNEIPFNGMNHYEIVKEVVENNKRPLFKKEVPSCYKDLIQNCWNQDPKKRPNFDEIKNILKTDERFITKEVNKELYQNYIRFVEGEGGGIQNQFISNKLNIPNSIENDTIINHLSFNFEPIELNQFELKKENILGEGSFGKVYKIFQKKTGNVFAAKILNHYLENYSLNQILNIKREVNNISKLNFPSIVKFIGYNQKNFNNKPKLTIITEFVSNGTLDDLIDLEIENKHNEKWNETKKLIVIYGIAAGMAYSHKQNIIHRDLKPANIFLDENLYPKIGDFGLSKNLIENDSIKKIIGPSGIKGSYAFIAPEVFTDLNYDKANDVFSFSLILYQILTNDPFYRSFSRYNILLKVPNGLRPEFKTEVPQCYKDLMCRCWSNDPNERLTFDEIVHLLKSDESFITEKVNKEEFLNYVKEIDKMNI